LTDFQSGSIFLGEGDRCTGLIAEEARLMIRFTGEGVRDFDGEVCASALAGDGWPTGDSAAGFNPDDFLSPMVYKTSSSETGKVDQISLGPGTCPSAGGHLTCN